MEEGPKSVFSQASRPKKYLVTIGLIYCLFAEGIALSFLNPTVLDFSHKLNESVDTVSIVFTVSSVASLCGALFGGIISNFFPRQLYVLLAITFLTVPFFIIPLVETVIMLYVLGAIVGFGVGCFDAAQGAWIIDIWRHEAAPYILSLHFAFSMGTLVPPLILGPYLTEEEEETDGTTTTPRTSSTELPYESQLQAPFIIGGCMISIALLIQVALYFVFRQSHVGNVDEKKPKKLEMEKSVWGEVTATEIASSVYLTENSKGIEPEDISSSSDLKRVLLLVGLCCCVNCFYQGLELCTSQFISTFSTFSEVNLSEKQGARIAFGLQMGFATGRLVGILLVLKIAPHFLLAGNFLLLLISNIILLVWAGSNVTWLWIGSVGFGLGMSTLYPALYAYIEKYVFVTDRISSTFVICGGLISGIYPLIVGNSVEENPQVLTYVNFFSLFICMTAFSVLFYVTHVRAVRKQRTEDAMKRTTTTVYKYSTF